MDTLPKYTLGTWVIAVVNMAHVGAIFLALLFLIFGLALIFWFPLIGEILFAISLWIIAVQVVSRVKFIRKLEAIRPTEGKLKIFHPGTKRWVPGNLVTGIVKEDYASPDPWRPVTLGFPGITITLKGIPEPAEVMFPYGFEDFRDRVFDYLTNSLPGTGIRISHQNNSN